ncbi:MAG: multiheme c-type cytochrome, partial [Bacteroidota bacterium]|nr:multiheme c-type cytochrome [Bacteroidota bacterium]
MKNVVRIILMTLVVVNIGWAQPRGVIKTEAVTGPMLTAMGLSTNSVSNGLDVVGNLTYVYLSAYNFGNADTIQTATFTLTSKPTGSSTTLTTLGSKWVYFKPDVKGTYTVNLHMVTATGSHDTTKTITASDWVGVGNFQGVAGNFPKCMTCHASNPAFTAIYNKWQNSGHANIFKEQLTTAASYSASCMKCHTTGYNFNTAVNNNGFDDIATTLGWTFTGVPSQAKWDSLKTYYPTLVNHATIGCEMCHGAGS